MKRTLVYCMRPEQEAEPCLVRPQLEGVPQVAQSSHCSSQARMTIGQCRECDFEVARKSE